MFGITSLSFLPQNPEGIQGRESGPSEPVVRGTRFPFRTEIGHTAFEGITS
jgi:hypothetical protein